MITVIKEEKFSNRFLVYKKVDNEMQCIAAVNTPEALRAVSVLFDEESLKLESTALI